MYSSLNCHEPKKVLPPCKHCIPTELLTSNQSKDVSGRCTCGLVDEVVVDIGEATVASLLDDLVGRSKSSL